MFATGEENVQQRYLQSRGDETDQPGGSRGRGGRGLFPRIPRHAGRVALPEGESGRDETAVKLHSNTTTPKYLNAFTEQTEQMLLNTNINHNIPQCLPAKKRR